MTALHFTLTRDLLLQAARAHNRSKWPRFLVVFTLFAGLVGLALSLFLGELDVWLVVEMIGVALATSLVMFTLTQLWTIPRKLRKALSYLDPESLDYDVEWDDAYLTTRTSDGHSSIKFVRLAGWRQAPTMLLIFRIPDQYYIIPDFAFENPAQRQELIARLRAAGVKELP